MYPGMPNNHFRFLVMLNGQSKKGMFDESLYGFQSPLLLREPYLLSSICINIMQVVL